MTGSALVDRIAPALQVADAVLYEGAVLYPYRASSGKNRLRWQFGVLAPGPYCEGNVGEQATQQSEVIVEFRSGASIDVRLRFLQMRSRTVYRIDEHGSEAVQRLDLGHTLHTSFDETIEHAIDVVDVPIGAIRQVPIDFVAAEDREDLHEADRLIGCIVRRSEPITARCTVTTTPIEGPHSMARVTVLVENTTAWNEPDAHRDEVVRHAIVGVHSILSARDGRFLSMVDPPEFASGLVKACTNIGTWPVMIDVPAENGIDSLMLSSPIILDDRPAVAPESPGDLCDAAEIDEILTLRIMTLTDDEKREARRTDPRAAAIIDRADTMPEAMLERLHGAVRSLRSLSDETPGTDSVLVGGIAVGAGSRVLLRPSRRADAQDLFLSGKTATVQAVLHDVDDEVHVAVTVDDDPAAEFHEWYGRFHYFRCDEVEPLPHTETDAGTGDAR